MPGPVITDMEIKAVKSAREKFAEALEEIGIMQHFENLTADQIDRIIWCCVLGFQTSMQQQSKSGEIPF